MTSTISLRGKQISREVTVIAHDNDNLTTSGPVQRTVADLLAFFFIIRGSKLRNTRNESSRSQVTMAITCKNRRYV